VGEPEEKTPSVRPRRRWEDGTKIDFKETGWGDAEWLYLAVDGHL
jgi:hypothetical protein